MFVCLGTGNFYRRFVAADDKAQAAEDAEADSARPAAVDEKD